MGKLEVSGYFYLKKVKYLILEIVSQILNNYL